MQRILLVPGMDLLTVDDLLDLAPINHLVARQEVARQEQEPCSVAVLSLVATRQARLSSLELVLGARVGKFPVAPRPDHDISRRRGAPHAAGGAGPEDDRLPGEPVDQRRAIGEAVRDEIRRYDYDEVVLATGREKSTLLAHLLGGDPVHLLRRLGPRPIVSGHSPAAASRSSGA